MTIKGYPNFITIDNTIQLQPVLDTKISNEKAEKIKKLTSTEIYMNYALVPIIILHEEEEKAFKIDSSCPLEEFPEVKALSSRTFFTVLRTSGCFCDGWNGESKAELEELDKIDQGLQDFKYYIKHSDCSIEEFESELTPYPVSMRDVLPFKKATEKWGKLNHNGQRTINGEFSYQWYSKK